MSLASVLDQNKDEYFAEISCGTLNASIINANVINGGGGGGGGISSITSTDSSLTVTSLNNGSTMNLTNAGQKWSTFNATSNINAANHAIVNVAELDLGIGTFTCPNNILTITNGGVGHYYDDHFNQPTMSDVASAGSSAGGYDITDVGSLGCTSLTTASIYGSNSNLNVNTSLTLIGENDITLNGGDVTGIGNLKCTAYLEIGNRISNTSQLHFCYTDGTTASDNIQLVGTSAGLTVQYYHNGTNPVNTLAVSNAGVLNVSNGTSTGRENDNTIYKPPSSSGYTPTVLAFTGNTNQTVVSGSTVAVMFNVADSANSLGSTGLVTDNTYFNKFTNPNGSNTQMLLQVSGYITWSNEATATSTRAVYIARNSNGSTDRYGYTNCASGSDLCAQPFSTTIVLAEGDYFEVYAWHNDTGNLSINGEQNFPPGRIIITRLA